MSPTEWPQTTGWLSGHVAGRRCATAIGAVDTYNVRVSRRTRAVTSDRGADDVEQWLAARQPIQIHGHRTVSAREQPVRPAGRVRRHHDVVQLVEGERRWSRAVRLIARRITVPDIDDRAADTTLRKRRAARLLV